MHMKLSALITACALTGCTVSGADRSEEIQTRKSTRPVDVGFVFYDQAGVHLYLKMDRVGPDDTLSLQYSSASGRAQCCHVLQGDEAEARSVADDSVSDEDLGASLFRYQVSREAAKTPFLGVVTVNVTDVSQQSDGSHLAGRTAAGPLDVVTCQSSEGVHLFVKQANKHASHLYYALGYEVTPTCPPGLFESQDEGGEP